MISTLFLAANLGLAHHSGVMFDREKEVTLKGTIQEFVFSNPHVSIALDVPDDAKGPTLWRFEAASTQGMVHAGWRKSTLKPGDKVTLIGRPLRDGRPGAQLVKAILSDGTVLQSNAGGNY